jgi:hypothetical protein
MRPGELAAAAHVKLEKSKQTRLFTKLADAGLILRRGNGRGAYITLPGKQAKEEP